MTTKETKARRKLTRDEIVAKMERDSQEASQLIREQAPDIANRPDMFSTAGRKERPEAWCYFDREEDAAQFVADFRAGRMPGVELFGVPRMFETPEGAKNDPLDGYPPIPHNWTVHLDAPSCLQTDNSGEFYRILKGLGVKPIECSDLRRGVFSVAIWADDVVSTAALAEVVRRTGATITKTEHLSNKATTFYHVDISTVEEQRIKETRPIL